MKLRGILLALLCVPSVVHAGGLFLPGSGAVSTSRAGAGVASSDDGEALALNPAGLAKTTGWTITISATMIDYFMQFTRAGSYDQLSETDTAYEGSKFPTIKNAAKPPLGFGGVQPVPVIAIISDLNNAIPGLHVAVGVFAPNAYPFRDMTNGYQFGTSGDDVAPPPSRYDIMKQEAAVILPSLAVAYHINDMFDVGARFSAGIANLKSTTVLWGMPQNFDEYVGKDGIFTIDAKDGFVPVFALGALFRPTPNLEFGINWESEASIQAKGSAASQNGKDVTLNGTPIVIKPPEDSGARCSPGGAEGALKACVGLSLPMNAQIGGRYKWLDSAGEQKADLEVNLDWEHWGKTCSVNSQGVQDDLNCTSPTTYRVTVDGVVFLRPGGGQPDMDTSLGLKDSTVSHGLKDTYGIRIGGSYRIPLDERHANSVILRGGLAYDTAAATAGWLRSDLDGAARTTITVGGAYKTKRYRIDAGGGVVLEGTSTNSNLLAGNQVCNPTGSAGNVGCADGITENPIGNRHGPDPINPLLDPARQAENPVTQGTYQSHYLMFMLGFTTWF